MEEVDKKYFYQKGDVELVRVLLDQGFQSGAKDLKIAQKKDIKE
jgi:hypothetical protein